MGRPRGLVHGVGINDVEGSITHKAVPEEILPSGKAKYIRCPYYGKWASMLNRCYSSIYLEKYPTYKGCTVCKEWLLFSNFRSWMVSKKCDGFQLDKDLLFVGNKVYSPATCVFVHRKVNMFTVGSDGARGDYAIGVYHTMKGSYTSQCNNPLTNKYERLGYFNTELEAHLVWKRRKHDLACELANSEYVTDERVAEALRKRYENFNIVEEHIS